MINPSMPRKAPIVEESFNSVNVSRREDIKKLTINPKIPPRW